MRIGTPFVPVEVEEILCLFGHQLFFTYAQPVKNQRAILCCKSHEILKNFCYNISTKFTIFYVKNLSDRQISITALSASRSDLGPLRSDVGYHD